MLIGIISAGINILKILQYTKQRRIVCRSDFQYYMPLHGFEEDETYTDSRALFEGLWQEWLDMKLYLMAKGTPLLEKGYKGALESLTEEKQSILIGRKADFAERAGVDL